MVQNCLVEAVRLGEHQREVVVIRGLVGPQTHGRGGLFDRLVEAAEFGIGFRGALLRPGILRALLHGLAPQHKVAAVVVVAPCRQNAAGDGDHVTPRQRLTSDHTVRAQRDDGDDGGERQIPPVFDDHLDRAGIQRCGRRNTGAPGSGQAERRFFPERIGGACQPRPNDRGEAHHVTGPLPPERAVFEDQRMGPQGELKVAGDRLERCKWIRPQRPAHAEADGAAAFAAGAEHERGEQPPGDSECRVESAALPPRRAPRAGDKRAVAEANEQRRGGHDLLRPHAEGTRDDLQAEPTPSGVRRGSGLGALREGVEREPIEKAQERLRALHGVGHGPGLQG